MAGVNVKMLNFFSENASVTSLLPGGMDDGADFRQISRLLGESGSGGGASNATASGLPSVR